MISYTNLLQAIEKGIHFEISYAPTIRDSGLRRRVLANAMDIARVTKGKVSYFEICKSLVRLGNFYAAITLNFKYLRSSTYVVYYRMSLFPVPQKRY